VLIDAAGAGVRQPWLLRIVGWPVVGRLAAALRGRWITGYILRSTYADPTKVRAEDVDQYYAPVADPDFARALRSVLRDFRFDALVGRLGVVETPTLVIWGGRDRLIPPRVGRALAAELQRVAFVPVARAGHAAPEEAPEEVNQLLVAFLTHGIPAVPPDLALGSRTLSDTEGAR
jgi:pimeloyl-ACP methyl ester carboxylesterase